ncbi:hypothetical protein NDU88_008774 [Pleurodeles waltl]|uniref:Uncharacterized protein n=1 Tax=Pleurodeles waltl TaxID=8319 RepID=A0AAV7PSK0_PLEWA|nr:hypothetical protein NDU88_008774 [Pleurodeles waltl]
MRRTKDGISKNFYKPDILCTFLDGLTERDTDLTLLVPEHALRPSPSPGSVCGDRWCTDVTRHTGKDVERLGSSQVDRSMAVKAVVAITSDHNRDKSQSRLKPQKPDV